MSLQAVDGGFVVGRARDQILVIKRPSNTRDRVRSVLQRHRFIDGFLLYPPDLHLLVRPCRSKLVTVDVESEGGACARVSNHLAFDYCRELVDLKIFMVLRHELSLKNSFNIPIIQ